MNTSPASAATIFEFPPPAATIIKFDETRIGVVFCNGTGIALSIEQATELRDKLAEVCPPPRVNIKCETKSGETKYDSVIGSTSLNVIRVEQEDDGSYTAVTDYWPKP